MIRGWYVMGEVPDLSLYKLLVCSTSLLKTLWKKEKLLVTSNFSFSHNVSYPLENFLPFSSTLRVLRGSVVKCLTRNPGVLGLAALDPLGFFVGVSLGKTLQSPA